MANPLSAAPRNTASNPKKRKQPEDHTFQPKIDPRKRTKHQHAQNRRDAHQIKTQAVSSAFKNGELDVDKFVKAREFEIVALEEGLTRSKTASHGRALQQLPKDLRRRTASHNVKKVPKRLRPRAQREMNNDDTPTVTSRRRKPTRHLRLRLDLAKKLRAEGARRKSEKEKLRSSAGNHTNGTAIVTRAPKVKNASLAKPPLPKAKFRKRQKSKSWLPTHLFHAKRAQMTPPSQPLWRFSIPLTSTAKSYRPTHHASVERGAIAWDVSYLSTIGLQGRADSLESVLKGLSIGTRGGQINQEIWGRRGARWRNGLRALDTFAFERENPSVLLAPVTVIWQGPALETPGTHDPTKEKSRVFLRVEPAGFLRLWEETLRLAKVAKPQVIVEDLRFEIGSIQITGPGSTEALLAVLKPYESTCHVQSADETKKSCRCRWANLAGLTNLVMLPPGLVLGLDVQDPRLRHPPRPIKLPSIEQAAEQEAFYANIVSLSADTVQMPASIFNRNARATASSNLPSQKAINRRKALAKAGEYPQLIAKDPPLPALLYTTPKSIATGKDKEQAQNSSWTLLLPWKCVQPVWYGLMYYPLSTGQQPRFGGLNEIRQLCFETGRPWFPADLPGTAAGWEWELQERTKRHNTWLRRPKSKRLNWDKVDLGTGKPGEIGIGWNCDWEKIIGKSLDAEASIEEQPKPESAPSEEAPANSTAASKPNELLSLRFEDARPFIDSSQELPQALQFALLTVRLTLITRGVPETCARVYRLPTTDGNLRKAWLALHPANQPTKHQPRPGKHALPRLPKDTPSHVLRQRLAASLLEPPKIGDAAYPRCPDEVDLIGFVTTGNFNLREGKGTGVGSILLVKVLEALSSADKDGRLCVVRNAGTTAGRLARWDPVL